MKPPFSLVVVLSMLTAVPTVAEACINGIEYEVNPKVIALQGAEAALRVRDLREAGRLASSALPNWRKVAPGKTNLEQRAVRVLAIVIVRTGGAWHERGKLTDSEARQSNLKNAVRLLRMRAIAKIADASRITDLGEALERIGEYAEARQVLESLAGSTSITSAEGWAALARLRARDGDEPGRLHAQTMCRTMTTKEQICLAPTAA
ncbi:MAG: hypothetical protein QM784_09085 [Polyangiaceae bacterium]